MLANEVTGLPVDDSSEPCVQGKQALIFFFVFQGQVVLLVDFVIAADGLLKAGPVDVTLVGFGGIVSQDQVVLQRSLKRFAHQVFKRRYPYSRAQCLLNISSLFVISRQFLQSALTLVEILEELAVDQQELRKANHGLSNRGGPSIPGL